MRLILASLLAVLFVACDRGAGSPPTAGSAGAVRQVIDIDGEERIYRLLVPASVAANPGVAVPLLIGLHGGLGSGDQFAENSGFDAIAEREGFLAAYPDGLRRTWNAGDCCGFAAREDVDDVMFILAVIADVQAKYAVEPNRVFVTGHSNGGMMAFRLGCEASDRVRAIAPVAGSLETASCPAGAGVNLLAIHGDSDRNHPIEGGEGSRSIAGVAFRSMADSMELWATAMECSPARSETDGALTHHRWSCRGGTTAQLTIIAGADHPWPGSEPAARRLQGDVSQAMDASEVIWAFFAGLK